MGSTPAPRANTGIPIRPWAVALRSLWKSSIKRRRATPNPATTQFPKNAKLTIGPKARAFLRVDQFNGSLTSSEGWGTKTMSFLVLSVWAAINQQANKVRYTIHKRYGSFTLVKFFER